MSGVRGARVLAVRLDSDGDVLLTGPAIRALAHTAERVDLLVSPAGRAAGELLPAVGRVHEFAAPWSGYHPPRVDPPEIDDLVTHLGAYQACVIFTSYHQSPLPMALLAKLAGVPYVAATCEDYPGSLLDLRHRRPHGLHEVAAALDLAVAAGGALAPDDDARLAVRGPLPSAAGLPVPLPAEPYVVLHPGASVPARGLAVEHAQAIGAALAAAGWPVVVTGGPGERALASSVARGTVDAGTVASGAAVDLAGRTTLAELATVLAGAAAVVVGNTGPAHLAAAVGTPVVSLFAPVVPAERWAPWGAHRLLGDQAAPCAGTRARECPVPGHPCVSSVAPTEVVAAVAELTGHDGRSPVLPAGPAGGVA